MEPLSEWEERVEKWLDENLNPYGEAKMVWVDLETTGLSEDDDKMIEIGVLITDGRCNVLPMGKFQAVVAPPEGIDWSKVAPIPAKMHEESGLREYLLNGDVRTVDWAEKELLAFFEYHFGPDMAALRLPVSGSSVHFDKKWIEKRMPRVSALFSHRIIDASSFHESAKASDEPLVDDAGVWESIGQHRVIPDLIDSIEMYRFYKGWSK